MQAYNAGLLFPRYIWITYSRDYMNSAALGDSCNALEFLNGAFSIVSTASAITEGLGSSFKQVLKPYYLTHVIQFCDAIFASLSVSITTFPLPQKLTIDNEDFTPLTYFAFDAVLTLANALNTSDSELLDPINPNVSAPLRNLSINGMTVSTSLFKN